MSIHTIVATGSLNNITDIIDDFIVQGYSCVGGLNTHDGITYFQLMDIGIDDSPYIPGDNMYSRVAINMYFTGSNP